MAKGAVNDATRELMARWERVRETWRDAKADEFGREYLSGLGEDISRAVRVIDELERLISRVHADCE
ncbi:hypothetical protein HAHE_28440 [Haloferula helveola]|uniref:Uncharacterized protein n=2 Tax=Haloferula helveola TaxID=490095 RepID=A0ABM7RGI7_9BACT|nr:hypothetical protein HAHE_28440 [Haloferula helveola]